jgi:hypothetical protein
MSILCLLGEHEIGFECDCLTRGTRDEADAYGQEYNVKFEREFEVYQEMKDSRK